MKLKVYLTKCQYLKYNMNYSGLSINTLMHNSYYLLGLYYNSSFINLNYSIYRIKYSLSVLERFSKINCFNFFLINIIENISIIKYYKKVMNKLRINYSLGRWKNGFLNNFHIRIDFLHNYFNLQMFLFCLPKFTFLIDYKDSKNAFDRVSPINLELYSISSNSIIISQASTNTKKTVSLTMQNIKGISSNIFNMNFILSILKKYKMFRKCLFFKSVVTFNRNSSNYTRNAKKIFYNYVFVKFNKHNFFKTIKWKRYLI